jgi:uncharacterized protein (TIGR03083 family)
MPVGDGSDAAWTAANAIGAAWRSGSFDPDVETEVEVLFTETTGGHTRVFDSPDGWTGTLTRFVDLANTKLFNGTEAVMATSEEALSTMQMACEEREDFADLLAGLSPQQWEQPSLCELWRVRDVVAHVLSYDELSRWELVRRFAKGGFWPNRVNAIGVAEYATRSPRQLTELMRSCIHPRGLTTGFGGMIALVDGTIHQQDIRRALGIPRIIPPHRLRAVLDYARNAPAVRGVWRARGVRLVATDLDWSKGNGPQVHGSGEALLMAMAARPVALDDLDGPGKTRLAQRIRPKLLRFW